MTDPVSPAPIEQPTVSATGDPLVSAYLAALRRGASWPERRAALLGEPFDGGVGGPPPPPPAPEDVT